MKCPECYHNQLRGKDGMTCKKCGYKFHFDPKLENRITYKITDSKFLSIIKRVSRDGTFYFTEDELYHVAALRTRLHFGGCFFVALLAGGFKGFFCAAMFNLKPYWLVGSSISVLSIAMISYLAYRFNAAIISRRKWNMMLKAWQNRFGRIPGLISEPGLHQAPDYSAEPDIYSYGTSQLIICQHDIQVDWLVLNDFHTANGAVIISESGYPEYVAQRVDDIVEQNPELKISLIHDASSDGEQMVTRVRKNWPFDSTTVNDIGITHDMIEQFGVNKAVRKSFGNTFPLHAVPFPVLSSLLSRSVADESTLDTAWHVTFESGTTLDGDGAGDGDGE